MPELPATLDEAREQMFLAACRLATLLEPGVLYEVKFDKAWLAKDPHAIREFSFTIGVKAP